MSINKEYVKYLEELGFQKCSLEQIKAYVPCEFEYIYNAYWFMYDGDLVLDRLETLVCDFFGGDHLPRINDSILISVESPTASGFT